MRASQKECVYTYVGWLRLYLSVCLLNTMPITAGIRVTQAVKLRAGRL
jgi:hypothetical protein